MCGLSQLMTTNKLSSANENIAPARTLLLQDVAWLVAIVTIMATAGIWTWLSPRPEIGQVAVLWLPSAVLAVALLRNWGRPVFCLGAIAVFIGVGVYPAIETKTELGAMALLIVDVIEVMILVLGLVVWFGKSFRLNTALNVATFGVVCVVACAIGGVLAGIVSQIPLGATVIATKAPLQVGVAWFTSDLATYFLVAAPIIALTGRGSGHLLASIRKFPLGLVLGAPTIMGLTFAGFAIPQWLALKTGLALGSGGLILVAFPLATYLAFTRGPAIAALTGAAIGVPAIYATMAGIGPFGSGNAAANVFDMQATLIVCVFTLLLIGAMGDEMRARSASLERALDEAIKIRQGRS